MADLHWLHRPPKPRTHKIVTAPSNSSSRTCSPVAVQGNIVDSYFFPADAPESARAQVLIAERATICTYFVRYPELTPEQADALTILKENLEYYFPSVEAFSNSEQMITQYLWKTAQEVGILGAVERSHEKLRYYLLRDALGFGKTDALFNDDNLEEISCAAWDRPVRVYHRRFTQHRFMETNIAFESEDELQRFVRRMAQLAGKSISRAQPAVEGTISYGPVEKRITATLGSEISRPGSSFAVRKQKENPLTVTQLAALEIAKPYPMIKSVVTKGPLYAEEHRHKTATALMIAYFWSLLEYKTNILICGEPMSGKTTFLNSILALTNPNAKIVTAEDVSEILLPENLHWERLITRHAPVGMSPQAQRLEVDLASLLKLSLRFSPTVLSLGEMRGEESESVANAMTIGYSTVCTVHAANTRDCITRITNPPMRFTVGHVRDISAIVTMGRIRLPDLREVRRAVSVDEIVPNELDPRAYEIRGIFQYRPDGDSFTPTAPEEVVERSYRLRKVAEYFGWNNEHMLASLTSRAAFIASAIRDGVFGTKELSDRLRAYYGRELVVEIQKGAEARE